MSYIYFKQQNVLPLKMSYRTYASNQNMAILPTWSSVHMHLAVDKRKDKHHNKRKKKTATTWFYGYDGVVRFQGRIPLCFKVVNNIHLFFLGIQLCAICCVFSLVLNCTWINLLIKTHVLPLRERNICDSCIATVYTKKYDIVHFHNLNIDEHK